MKKSALRRVDFMAEEMTPRSGVASRLILAGFLYAALAAVPAMPGHAAEGYKVIVHASNPATSLSREEIARYFLKKTPAWPSGKAVVVVDQTKESAAREAFSRDVLKKAVGTVTSYWQQKVYSGLASPPIEKKGDAAVVAFVEDDEAAVGYVSAGASVGGAKVVRVE